jgi:hypothetical protein
MCSFSTCFAVKRIDLVQSERDVKTRHGKSDGGRGKRASLCVGISVMNVRVSESHSSTAIANLKKPLPSRDTTQTSRTIVLCFMVRLL